jgi:hypothetical protein
MPTRDKKRVAWDHAGNVSNSMRPTMLFKARNGKEFLVKGTFTCHSVGCIYGMHCKVCQYVVNVGKSQNSKRECFYAHRRDFTIKDIEKPA